MSLISPVNGSIHGIQAYISYSPTINFSSLQAFIPFIYIIPTYGIMITVLVMYRNAKGTQFSATMDSNVFILIMLYFLFNSLFFIGDYLRLNLPSSGIITSICARFHPSRWLGAILIYAYASNYGTITCPFLICLVRLTIMVSPRQNQHYVDLLMRYFAIPFLFIVPNLLVVCNFSIVGYFRQMDSPFSFGSVILYEGDEMYHLNTIIHLSYSCFIFISTFLMSCAMVYQLRKTVMNTTSARTKELTRKVNLSLSLTMISSLVPFITNSIVSITYLTNRANWFSALILQPIGNDYETVMMPWVLFLTHPLFSRKKMTPKLSTSSIAFKTSSNPRLSIVAGV